MSQNIVGVCFRVTTSEILLAILCFGFHVLKTSLSMVPKFNGALWIIDSTFDFIIFRPKSQHESCHAKPQHFIALLVTFLYLKKRVIRVIEKAS